MTAERVRTMSTWAAAGFLATLLVLSTQAVPLLF